jgi:hypothetical protein
MAYVVVGIAVAIALLVWRGAAGAEFVITARAGAVRCKGNLAGGARVEIEEFFRNDVHPQGTWKILGSRNGQGLQLRIRGRMSDAERQRIRNFLLATLGG